jgi:hypothetical protein
MGFFGTGGRRAFPPTVPTDTIIPFHFFDDAKHTNGLCFDFTFRFDDGLNGEKLRGALSRLLEIGGWRKLGARIRGEDAGTLQYHVPKCYDDELPASVFSMAKFEIAVDKHPQASLIAQPHNLDTAGSSVAFRVPSYVESLEFRSIIRSLGFPERLDSWLYSDSPQLGVHIVYFENATLMTLSFLHSLTVMMDLSAVVDAWTTVLSRDEEHVKPFVGFSDGPLGQLSQIETKPLIKYRFAEKLLMGWN